MTGRPASGLVTMGRRGILAAAGGAGAALFMPYVARGQAALQKVTVSVGRIPWSALNSPMTQIMINSKLFERRAAEFGFDVTVDWRSYPTALPMVEAVIGNNLDMGMWGNTPIIRAIPAKLPVSLMEVVKDDVLFERGWSWPTESDARAVLETSKHLVENKMIEKPLTWAQVKASFSGTAPLVKQAYDYLGAKPAAAEFTRTDVSDLRGLPVWDIEHWTERS